MKSGAIALLTGIVLCFSCGNPSPKKKTASEYELKYLVMIERELKNTITADPFKSSISIHTSGNQTLSDTQIQRSVLTWLEPLRQISSNIAGSVTVNQGNNPHVEVRFSRGNGRAYANLDRRPVFIQLYGDDGYEVLLHEMGHAMGLRDTYLENSWGCQKGQPDSVMCQGETSYLLSDDISGVKDVFCRLHPSECKGGTGGGGSTGSGNTGGGSGGGGGNSCNLLSGQSSPAACSQMRLANLSGDPLNVRSQPGVNQSSMGSLREGTQVRSLCQFTGSAAWPYQVQDPSTGKAPSSTWIYIQSQNGISGWVSSLYVECL